MAVIEGEGLSTPPAPFALMNLPDVLGKRILGEAFPAVLELDLDLGLLDLLVDLADL